MDWWENSLSTAAQIFSQILQILLKDHTTAMYNDSPDHITMPWFCLDCDAILFNIALGLELFSES